MERGPLNNPIVFGIITAFLVVVVTHSFWPAVIMGVGVGMVVWMGETASRP